MGDAKRRGTYEQRKAEAEKKNAAEQLVEIEVQRRRTSPKHTKTMQMLMAMALLGESNIRSK